MHELRSLILYALIKILHQPNRHDSKFQQIVMVKIPKLLRAETLAVESWYAASKKNKNAKVIIMIKILSCIRSEC